MDPISAAIINLLIGVVLSVASSLASQAFGGKKDEARGYRGSKQVGGKVPKSFLVGTIGVPGKLEYRGAWGNAGKTPNAYYVEVLSFGDLPITAFTGLWVNGQPVTIPATNHVTQGYPVPEYGAAAAAHLWREFFDGNQTTANTYLTGKFGSDPVRPWTSDMIGRGVPYLTLTALIDETLWTGFPSFMAQFQGIKLYDRRKDSTAGGSGTQRRNNPSTWAFTDNSAVIIENILRGIHYNLPGATTLGEWMWGGHATDYQLPYAVWAAAMDACDQNVSLAGGGTEKRFRAGREIFVNERPADIIKELLIGANARIAHAAGQYFILVGLPAVADGSLTDADVIVTDPTTLEEIPSLDDVVNGATATYLEPSQAWESKETAPYIRADLVADDDDRQQVEGRDLPTTFSGTQAQRVLKAVVEESRRFRRHVVPLAPVFGVYRPLQVLEWISDANGYSDKQELITSRAEDQWGRVVLGFQEVDPADHDWVPGTDEQPLTFAPMTPIRPAAQVTTGFSVAPYTVVDNTGSGRRPGIEVFWDAGLDDVDYLRIQVRESWGSKKIIAEVTAKYDIAATSPSLVISNLAMLPNKVYEVRGIYLPPASSGRTTRWSNQDVNGVDGAWLTVTTPNVLLGDSDIYPISITGLNSDLLRWQERAANSIRDIREKVLQQSLLLINRASANRLDQKRIREEIVAQVEGNTVKWSNEITLVASDVGVLGARVEQLEASLSLPGGAASVDALNALEADLTLTNGNVIANASAITALQGVVGYESGSATFRLDMSYTPSAGWTNGFALQARVDSSSAWKNIGIYGEVTSSLGRIVLDADIITVRAGGTPAAVFESGTTFINVARVHDLDADNITVKSIDADEILIDGTIITALIDDGAVNTTLFSSPSSGSVSNTASKDISVTVTGYVSGPITISTKAQIITAQSNPTGFYRLAILENGVQIASVSFDASVASGSSPILEIPSLTVWPGSAGSYTYLSRVSTNFVAATTVNNHSEIVVHPKK